MASLSSSESTIQDRKTNTVTNIRINSIVVSTSMSDGDLISTSSRRLSRDGHPPAGSSYGLEKHGRSPLFNISFTDTVIKSPVISDSKCNFVHSVFKSPFKMRLNSRKFSTSHAENLCFAKGSPTDTSWKRSSCTSVNRDIKTESPLSKQVVQTDLPGLNRIKKLSGTGSQAQEVGSGNLVVNNLEEKECVSDSMNPSHPKESDDSGNKNCHDEAAEGSSSDTGKAKDSNTAKQAKSPGARYRQSSMFSMISTSNVVSCNRRHLQSDVSCCPHCRLSSTPNTQPLVHIKGICKNPVIDPITVTMLQSQAKAMEPDTEKVRVSRSSKVTQKPVLKQCPGIPNRSQNSSGSSSQAPSKDDSSSSESSEGQSDTDSAKGWILSRVRRSSSPPFNRESAQNRARHAEHPVPSKKVHGSRSNIENRTENILDEPPVPLKHEDYIKDLVDMFLQVLSSKQSRTSINEPGQEITGHTKKVAGSQSPQTEDSTRTRLEKSRTCPSRMLHNPWNPDDYERDTKPLLQVKYKAPVTWSVRPATPSKQENNDVKKTQESAKPPSITSPEIKQVLGKILPTSSSPKAYSKRPERQKGRTFLKPRHYCRLDSAMKTSSRTNYRGNFSTKKTSILMKKHPKKASTLFADSIVKSRPHQPSKQELQSHSPSTQKDTQLQRRYRPDSSPKREINTAIPEKASNPCKKMNHPACVDRLSETTEAVRICQGGEKMTSHATYAVTESNNKVSLESKETRKLNATVDSELQKLVNNTKKSGLTFKKYDGHETRKANTEEENLLKDGPNPSITKEPKSNFKSPVNEGAGVNLTAILSPKEEFAATGDNVSSSQSSNTETFVTKYTQLPAKIDLPIVDETYKRKEETHNNVISPGRLQMYDAMSETSDSTSDSITDNNAENVKADPAPETDENIFKYRFDKQGPSCPARKIFEVQNAKHGTFQLHGRRTEQTVEGQVDARCLRFQEGTLENGEATEIQRDVQTPDTKCTAGRMLPPELNIIARSGEAVDICKTSPAGPLVTRVTSADTKFPKHTNEHEKPSVNFCGRPPERPQKQLLADKFLVGDVCSNDSDDHLLFEVECQKNQISEQNSNLPQNLIFSYQCPNPGGQPYPQPSVDLESALNRECERKPKLISAGVTETIHSPPRVHGKLPPSSKPPLTGLFHEEKTPTHLDTHCGGSVNIQDIIQELKQKILLKKRNRQFRQKYASSRMSDLSERHLKSSVHKAENAQRCTAALNGEYQAGLEIAAQEIPQTQSTDSLPDISVETFTDRSPTKYKEDATSTPHGTTVSPVIKQTDGGNYVDKQNFNCDEQKPSKENPSAESNEHEKNSYYRHDKCRYQRPKITLDAIESSKRNETEGPLCEIRERQIAASDVRNSADSSKTHNLKPTQHPHSEKQIPMHKLVSGVSPESICNSTVYSLPHEQFTVSNKTTRHATQIRTNEKIYPTEVGTVKPLVHRELLKPALVLHQEIVHPLNPRELLKRMPVFYQESVKPSVHDELLKRTPISNQEFFKPSAHYELFKGTPILYQESFKPSVQSELLKDTSIFCQESGKHSGRGEREPVSQREFSDSGSGTTQITEVTLLPTPPFTNVKTPKSEHAYQAHERRAPRNVEENVEKATFRLSSLEEKPHPASLQDDTNTSDSSNDAPNLLSGRESSREDHNSTSCSEYMTDAAGSCQDLSHVTQQCLSNVQDAPLDLSQKPGKPHASSAAVNAHNQPATFSNDLTEFGSSDCTDLYSPEQEFPLNLCTKNCFRIDSHQSTESKVKESHRSKGRQDFSKNSRKDAKKQQARMSSGFGGVSSNPRFSKDDKNAEINLTKYQEHAKPPKHCTQHENEDGAKHEGKQQVPEMKTFHEILKDWVRTTFLNPTQENLSSCNAVPQSSETQDSRL